MASNKWVTEVTTLPIGVIFWTCNPYRWPILNGVAGVITYKTYRSYFTPVLTGREKPCLEKKQGMKNYPVSFTGG